MIGCAHIAKSVRRCQDLLFGFGETSLKSYYNKQSSGRLNLEGSVTDWVRLRYNEARYGRGPDSDTSFLVKDALDAWVAQQPEAGRTPAEIATEVASFDRRDDNDFDHDGNFNEPDGSPVRLDTGGGGRLCPGVQVRFLELCGQGRGSDSHEEEIDARDELLTFVVFGQLERCAVGEGMGGRTLLAAPIIGYVREDPLPADLTSVPCRGGVLTGNAE
jgi:Immune inhibitor A peptidase M6